MSELDAWLFSGPAGDNSFGVLPVGSGIAEQAEALAERMRDQLQANCGHQRIQAIHVAGRTGLEGRWQCVRCGLEDTWAELTSKAILVAYGHNPAEARQ